MEINETGIKRFLNEDEALEALKGHFKAERIEKHPDAMLNLFFREAGEKYLENYNKQKISKSVEEKIRAYVLKKLRRYYGEWANIYDFTIKKALFQTNFQSIYKTENGRLYGSYPGTIHDHVFYTAHAFEQYKARSFCFDIYKMVCLAFRRIRNTEPTAADIMKFLVLNSNEYCIQDNFFYVNVLSGVVVFEKLSGGLVIAKTFLAPEMKFPKKGWILDVTTSFRLDLTDSMKKFFKENEDDSTPIKEPVFTEMDINYADCVKIMKHQSMSQVFDV
jgi:hypothetical protein